MLKNYNKFVRSISFIVDLILLILSFLISHYIRLGDLYLNESYIILLLLSILCWILISYYLGTYKNTIKFILKNEIFSVIKLVVLFFTFISIIAFFFKSAAYSRLMILGFSIIQLFLVSLSRVAINSIIRNHIKADGRKKVIILGAGRVGQAIFEELNSHPEYGYKIIGFLDDRPANPKPSKNIIGGLSKLESILTEKDIYELFIALPLDLGKDLNSIVKTAEYFGVKTRIIPDFHKIFPYKLKLEKIGSLSALSFRDIPLEDITNRLVKRLFDIIFSSLVLILGSPLLVLIAILVKISSKGPIFFIQERTGYNQKTFLCYKFRTMKVTSKEVSDSQQATEDDPRKTKIGDFLRNTNLDELPQFFNVLKGDMSVVGPRPHMLHHTEEFRNKVDGYMTRHFVKPGITGWAQVNGWRGPTDTQEKIEKRVEYDLWYIENWCFWLDVKIIFMTVFSRQSKLNAF